MKAEVLSMIYDPHMPGYRLQIVLVQQKEYVIIRDTLAHFLIRSGHFKKVAQDVYVPAETNLK